MIEELDQLAYECRKVCGVTRFNIPALLAACLTAACTCESCT